MSFVVVPLLACASKGTIASPPTVSVPVSLSVDDAVQRGWSFRSATTAGVLVAERGGRRVYGTSERRLLAQIALSGDVDSSRWDHVNDERTL